MPLWPGAFEQCTNCATVRDIPNSLSIHRLIKCSLSPRNGKILSPILHLKTLKLRQAELLAQGHRAGTVRVLIQPSDYVEVSTALGPESRDLGPQLCHLGHMWLAHCWNILLADTHTAYSLTSSDLCPDVVPFSGSLFIR